MPAPKCPKCGKRSKSSKFGAHCRCGWGTPVTLPRGFEPFMVIR